MIMDLSLIHLLVWDFSLLLLSGGTDSSGMTCSKKQNFGADGMSIFKNPWHRQGSLVQPVPPQCSRNSVTLQLYWKCISQNTSDDLFREFLTWLVLQDR